MNSSNAALSPLTAGRGLADAVEGLLPNNVRNIGSTTASINAFETENSRLAIVENITSFHAGRTKGNIFDARSRTEYDDACVT
jgi:hypothetical protein